jgi:hypothetical protein
MEMNSEKMIWKKENQNSCKKCYKTNLKMLKRKVKILMKWHSMIWKRWVKMNNSKETKKVMRNYKKNNQNLFQMSLMLTHVMIWIQTSKAKETRQFLIY